MVNHMRHNRGQTGSRRSHDALKDAQLSLCSDCKMPRPSHTVCLNCGKYKGRVIIDVLKKSEKKSARLKEKTEAAR